jgi:hypothetical protein
MDNENILKRIRDMFDAPIMQNNLRGLWVEVLVSELLGSDWKHSGNDWAAWDLERCDGLRIEVKQSAAVQSWGPSTSSPRFSIAASKGYYPDGKTYELNPSHKRFADLYIFAWHEGYDQRAVSEWRFYVVKADRLPEQQKSIGLAAIKKLSTPVGSEELLRKINGVSG